jgi:hypothetical protein
MLSITCPSPFRHKHARGGALVARAAASTSFGIKTTLRILLANQVNFGERHAVFGAGDALKNWQEAVEMEWSDAGWVTDLGALQPGQKVRLINAFPKFELRISVLVNLCWRY